jgi:hypothetical protein
VSAQYVQGSGFNSSTLLNHYTPKKEKNKQNKQNGEEDEWRQCHFIHLLVEGLKSAKIKPLNYSQVTVVQQGPEENPEELVNEPVYLRKPTNPWPMKRAHLTLTQTQS